MNHHDPYTAGVLAAIHGWPVCPCAGWHYQRDWWAGYKEQIRTQRGHVRKTWVKSDRNCTRRGPASSAGKGATR